MSISMVQAYWRIQFKIYLRAFLGFWQVPGERIYCNMYICVYYTEHELINYMEENHSWDTDSNLCGQDFHPFYGTKISTIMFKR